MPETRTNARNFLIPQGYASLATASAKRAHEEMMKQKAHKENKLEIEAEELLLVFPEFLDQELTELDKLPSVTCVEKEECLLPSKLIEDGTEKLM